MNIVQFSIALHCCIQSLHLLHFKMKVACICIPKKIMFILGNKCIDERSSKGVNILFSHKAKDLLAHFIGLKVLTFILSQDSKSSPLSFRGLKVLTFIGLKVLTLEDSKSSPQRTQGPSLQRTQGPRLRGLNVLAFRGLKLLILEDSKSLPSQVEDSKSSPQRTQSPCLQRAQSPRHQRT